MNAGGVAAVVDFIGETRGNVRLPGVMMLGYVAAHSENLAMAVIVSKVSQLVKEHHTCWREGASNSVWDVVYEPIRLLVSCLCLLHVCLLPVLYCLILATSTLGNVYMFVIMFVVVIHAYGQSFCVSIPSIFCRE